MKWLVIFLVIHSLVCSSISTFDFTLGSPQNLVPRQKSTTPSRAPVPDNFIEREDLKFVVNVVYKSAEGSDGMKLRGNALGLSWEESAPMEKVDSTTWTYEFTYKDSEAGATCMGSPSCQSGPALVPGEDFTFRAWLERGGQENEMLGYDFIIPTPLSKVSSFFPEPPSYTVYPFFFESAGQVETLTVTSVDPDIGTRRMAIYLPPGVTENPKPEYDSLIGIDFNPEIMASVAPTFDYMFTERGRAKEAVIVGHGDFNMLIMDDRTNLLTPTEALYYDCAEGSFLDACNNCYPVNGTVDEIMWWLLFGGCGVYRMMGGKADQSLDFILDETYPLVDELLQGLADSRLTRNRERTIIIGYSFGGLMSCHAALSRPEIFGRAACQSPSLWWPMYFNMEAETYGSDYFTLNETLPSYLASNVHPRQWILMDGGTLEEDPTFHMAVAPGVIFDALLTETDQFEAGKNLWYHVYPGEAHSGGNWIARIWSALELLSIDRADPLH